MTSTQSTCGTGAATRSSRGELTSASSRTTNSGSSKIFISCSLRHEAGQPLVHARQVDAEPAAGIAPGTFEREAAGSKNGIDRRDCVLVAVLGMNALAVREAKLQAQGSDIHRLVARTFKVHLHARVGA